MRTVLISSNTEATRLEAIVPDEFADVIQWLVEERLAYQPTKYDYDETDLEHALQGLTEDSWFWTRGIENYAGRVRTFQAAAEGDGDRWFDNPLAIQAILKLAATMACIPEHLLRGAKIERLPRAGLPSGALT